MGRAPDCNCHCCESYTPAEREPIHRDLVTGEPLENQTTLDALELLWSCHDGDVSGLTQETVAINCTAETSVSVHDANAPGDTARSLQFSIYAEPSDDDFAALHIVWTGETFDAFKHLEHIAAGSLAVQCAARFRQPSSFTAGAFDQVANQVWGLVIRANDQLFVVHTLMGVGLGSGGSPDDESAQCWRIKGSSAIRVIEGGHIRPATADELRAASLQVDPIASQATHEVGLFFGIVNNGFGNTAAASYTATYQLDMIDFYSIYTLSCVAAFVNKNELTISCPSTDAANSNVEPVEMRGFSATLDLTTLPDWDVLLHSRALQPHHDAGYAYVGSGVVTTALGDVTVNVWYTPCSRVTLLFDNGGACPAWVHILHSGNNYSQDACEDPDDPYFADNGNGKATAPTFAGLALRDYYRPCVSPEFNLLLDVPWFGSDCVDNLNESSTRRVDGIVGQCNDAFPGYADPVCVQGILPNQLYWMTNCYSLDPIAIGYRRRVKDGYGFGSLGGCGSSTPYCDAAPDGQYWWNTYCGISHLKSMGFTFALDGILGAANHVSGHFYMDITE